MASAVVKQENDFQTQLQAKDEMIEAQRSDLQLFREELRRAHNEVEILREHEQQRMALERQQALEQQQQQPIVLVEEDANLTPSRRSSPASDVTE